MKESNPNPFALDFRGSVSSPFLRALLWPVERILERALCLRNLQERYKKEVRESSDQEDVVDKVLDVMGVSHAIERGDITRIPTEKPLIVVANHPFGGIEGVVLTKLLRSVRPDVKIMANYLLSRVEEMRRYFIFVDPFGNSSSVKRNIGGLRDAICWLRQGGVLGIFPAGTVSHFQLRRRDVSDPEWNATVVRLVRRTQSAVLPVFFHGTNGILFQLAGFIHPSFRTALLAREFHNKRNSVLRVSVGSVIPYNKLSEFESDEDMLEYLRLRTYILGSGKLAGEREISLITAEKEKKKPKQAPIELPQDPVLLEREVRNLPRHQILLDNEPYLVLYARARQIPRVLHEIGRLREVTFREVEEGTGRSIDLDHFDNFYTHLFVWNTKKREIVGAYRMVKSDYVLRRYGKRGFYTFTLFRYKSSLLRQIGPALELGRSFVRPEYQKEYQPLLLLWRGIGQYVARNPRYNVLFGPVSINSEYDDVSRFLIATFLKLNKFVPGLSKAVKARNPMPRVPIRGIGKDSARVVRDLKDVSELLSEIEAKHKTVPVLLRQYLKLDAKLLGFNVDPSFGDVLDGLICVDVAEADPCVLERYFLKEAVRVIREYHGKECTLKPTGT